MDYQDKFRALHAFTRQYPNRLKSWEYVEPDNYDLIRVYTETRILTVQYDPGTERISIKQNEENWEAFDVPQSSQVSTETHSSMRCPKCGSNHVNVQIVTESQLHDKHHGCLWWLLIGSWWVPIKWLVFTLPALIFKIFVPKRQKIVTEHYSMGVCQSCGHTWKA